MHACRGLTMAACKPNWACNVTLSLLFVFNYTLMCPLISSYSTTTSIFLRTGYLCAPYTYMYTVPVSTMYKLAIVKVLFSFLLALALALCAHDYSHCLCVTGDCNVNITYTKHCKETKWQTFI